MYVSWSYSSTLWWWHKMFAKDRHNDLRYKTEPPCIWKGRLAHNVMSAFVSHKPELSENVPVRSMGIPAWVPERPHVAQVAGSLKKEGHFPTPSATALPTATVTRMAVAISQLSHRHTHCLPFALCQSTTLPHSPICSLNTEHTTICTI